MAPVRQLYCTFPSLVIVTHALEGYRLKGAHIYIDLVSIAAPIVHWLKFDGGLSKLRGYAPYCSVEYQAMCLGYTIE